MTGTYALNDRTRRIFIAVLAFALVAGLAIATSIAPAGADDPKEFKLFVDEIVDDIGTPSTTSTQVTVTQGSTGATFTFQNPDDATNTQQA
ncbi:MAG: hypothetical protein IIC70_13485, partial [Acidobacteria bacterium]|nr:hypothetical protein [Acidobacteriota bacterium]